MAPGYTTFMNDATLEVRSAGWTFYYGWVVLGVAALAMVGTLWPFADMHWT